MRAPVPPATVGLLLASIAIFAAGCLRAVSVRPQNEHTLSAACEETLQQEGLLDAYRRDGITATTRMRERLDEQPSTARRLAVVELHASVGDQLAASAPFNAAGYHAAAAKLALPGMFDTDDEPVRSGLERAYNYSVGRAAQLLFDAGSDFSRPLRFEIAGATYLLGFRTRGAGLVDPRWFDRIAVARDLEMAGFGVERHVRDGVGAAMVGHREDRPERERSDPFIGPFGLALPFTATLEAASPSGDMVLSFYDDLVVDRATLADKRIPLAADFTLPLAVLVELDPVKHVHLKGLLRPEDYAERAGLFQIDPFRPNQIPVVYVHGLLADTKAWFKAANELRDDPIIRARYQFLAFHYPTGFPIIYNAAVFRAELARFQAHYDPERRNPALREIVLVGHSMGGILSNAQIRSSRDTLTRRYLTRPLDEIEGVSDAQREALEQLLVYDANPDVTRVVFMATPHRGSAYASNFLGSIGRSLVRYPIQSITAEPLGEVEGLSKVGQETVARREDSIDSLRPDNPYLAAVLEQPRSPRTTYHSVIGQYWSDRPIEEGSDGVVAYRSAHLADAASEEIVHSRHTPITGHPDAVAELRRILYLHIGLDPPPDSEPAAAGD